MNDTAQREGELRPKFSMRGATRWQQDPVSAYLAGCSGSSPRRAPDLLRAMVTTFAGTLMGAEAGAVWGAAYGERSDERCNTRNGCRRRGWDTRAGSIRLAIPKLRQGSHFRTGCWSIEAAVPSMVSEPVVGPDG
jgi:hypothetical protein